MSQLLIIGGGITGLAAAWEAVQFPRVEVTLIDAQPRLGGKILGSEIAIADKQPLMIDEGADAFLARVPDAVQLCKELGLEEEFTHPAVGRAQVFLGGELRFLPTDTVLGVPLNFESLAASGLLSAAAVERILNVKEVAPAGAPRAAAVPRVAPEALQPMLPQLLTHLFAHIARPDYPENEYLM